LCATTKASRADAMRRCWILRRTTRCTCSTPPGCSTHGLIFKGGTALRKFRAGNAGRFSTDLDFAAPGREAGALGFAGSRWRRDRRFAFAIENLGDDGRRGDLKVETPFGRPQLGAKVELARHALSLSPRRLTQCDYRFTTGTTSPAADSGGATSREAVSEKLARYRRVSLARDLYDLQWFATSGTLDEAAHPSAVGAQGLPRYRGRRPRHQSRSTRAEVLRPRNATEFRQEDIGYLTKPVRLDEWIATVRSRYAFVARLDADERRWIECNERDLYEVHTALASMTDAAS